MLQKMKTKSDFWPRLANDALEIVVSMGFVPGLIIGFFAGGLIMGSWVRHVSERYTMTEVGHTVMRTDTRTGQSWLFRGSWVPIPETTAHALTAPTTFISDSQPAPTRTTTN